MAFPNPFGFRIHRLVGVFLLHRNEEETQTIINIFLLLLLWHTHEMNFSFSFALPSLSKWNNLENIQIPICVSISYFYYITEDYPISMDIFIAFSYNNNIILRFPKEDLHHLIVWQPSSLYSYVGKLSFSKKLHS
jgi:hypothetical protein